MRDKKLVIADGHHRYETALNYRNERRAAVGASSVWRVLQCGTRRALRTGDDDAGQHGQPGPGHSAHAPRGPRVAVVFCRGRFARGPARTSAWRRWMLRSTPARAEVILREAGRIGHGHAGGHCGPRLSAGPGKAVPSDIFDGLSLRQQSLDVVQLHKCLLEGVLGISEEAIREQKNVRYIRDIGEAMAQVRSGAANVAFLMNPAAHGAGARYCLCRRSSAAEVDGFLSQAADWLDRSMRWSSRHPNSVSRRLDFLCRHVPRLAFWRSPASRFPARTKNACRFIPPPRTTP